MGNTSNQASGLEWTARIVSMLFAGFISIFAMDVFEDGYTGLKLVTALFMHLIPTFLLILVIWFSWKYNLVGTIVFFGLAAFYLFFAWGKFHWTAYVFISGPLFLLGLMHLLVWRRKRRPTE